MLILNIRASVSLAVRGGDYKGDGGTRPQHFLGGDDILAPVPVPHHSEEIAATVYDRAVNRAFQFGQKKFRFDSIRFSLLNRFFRFDSAI